MYIEKSFDLKLFKFVFINFALSGKDLERKLEEVLIKLDRTIGLENIARQTLFIPPSSNKERVIASMNSKFAGLLPATSFVHQPLCNREDLGAEVWAFVPNQEHGHIKKISDNLTIAHISNLKWAFFSGIESKGENFFPEKVNNVFQETTRLLNGYDFELHQLIRTWYYAGDILGEEDGKIRYDIMNKIRNKFYHPIWEKVKCYPASTGIGMSGKGFILDGIALQANPKEVTIIRINNPLQTDPCDYTINKPIEEKPTFSRGITINCNNYHIIFISGTASVRKSAVVFKDNIEKQAKTTIENIAYLIGENNLIRRYGLPKGASLKDIQQIRVYLKIPQYYTMVKKICEEAFGKIPQIYCTADICRPSLLIEIEAVAILEP